ALAFTLSATDPDVVAGVPDSASYSILSGVQTGMSLNATTGAFSWTPSETQHGSYTVTFRDTDNHDATSDWTITITVNEVNTAPRLSNPFPYTTLFRSALAFTLSATDPDVVAGVPDSASYAILSGVQTGMSLNATTGAFSWTPSE